jgi:hypothetical protein
MILKKDYVGFDLFDLIIDHLIFVFHWKFLIHKKIFIFKPWFESSCHVVRLQSNHIINKLSLHWNKRVNMLIDQKKVLILNKRKR